MGNDKTLDTDSYIVGVMTVVILIALYPIAYCLEAVCVVQLWKWYAVPFFHLPPLSIPEAIGLAMIGLQLSYRPLKPKETAKWSIFEIMLLQPPFCLLVGWIARFWL